MELLTISIEFFLDTGYGIGSVSIKKSLLVKKVSYMHVMFSNKKNVSVLLASCNGSKYIEAQLESIFNQTYPVKEVIIKDDCSVDNTCMIVQNFIRENQLQDTWKLIRNENNQGWKKNFVDGLNYVHGDYILFCDQDDIWNEYKIEKILKQFELNSEIELIATNYNIFKSDSSKSWVKSQDKVDGTVSKYNAQKRFLYVLYPGCTYCFKKELLHLYKEFWEEIIPHDAFVWHFALIRGSLYIYNEKLINYRRHENTVTGRTINNKAERLKDIEYLLVILRYYKENDGYYSCHKRYIDEAEKWLTNRCRGLSGEARFSILKNYKYISYYWSWKTFIMDVFLTFI